MNGNDIFLAVDAVCDREIEEALELDRGGRSRRGKGWIAAAAAACLIIGIGAAMAAAVLTENNRLFSDPVYMQFMREFEQWEPTYELTETERRLEEKGVSRVDIAMDRFKEIWKRDNSEELAARLEEIEARMDDWRENLTGLREYLEVCRAEELARLIGLGYPIETNEFGQWCSKLTADQINAFPADPGWGYKILWASDGEGFV